MILKQDLKRLSDGMHVEVVRADEYDSRALPTRVQETTLRARLAERGINAKSSEAAEEKKVTISKED